MDSNNGNNGRGERLPTVIIFLSWEMEACCNKNTNIPTRLHPCKEKGPVVVHRQLNTKIDLMEILRKLRYVFKGSKDGWF